MYHNKNCTSQISPGGKIKGGKDSRGEFGKEKSMCNM